MKAIFSSYFWIDFGFCVSVLPADFCGVSWGGFWPIYNKGWLQVLPGGVWVKPPPAPPRQQPLPRRHVAARGLNSPLPVIIKVQCAVAATIPGNSASNPNRTPIKLQNPTCKSHHHAKKSHPNTLRLKFVFSVDFTFSLLNSDLIQNLDFFQVGLYRARQFKCKQRGVLPGKRFLSKVFEPKWENARYFLTRALKLPEIRDLHLGQCSKAFNPVLTMMPTNNDPNLGHPGKGEPFLTHTLKNSWYLDEIFLWRTTVLVRCLYPVKLRSVSMWVICFLG